jgi:nucleoside-diphosphate-sugar epimerase
MGNKILLTGHNGFIGSALEPKLVEKGYRVVAPDIDINKYVAISRYVERNKPDYAIHLASTNSVPYSYEHYTDVIGTNFIATANLAEACRRLKNFRQFIFPSSSEVYGCTLKDRKGLLTEAAALQPNSPHAVSKVAAEVYLEYMGRVYSFPYTILRPSNTYGRADNPDFFVESVITRMLSNSRVKLGNPEAVRDFLFVEDHIDAYIKALGNKKAIGQTINICTGKGNSILETSRKIAKLINFKGEIKCNKMPARPNEAKIIIADNSKARRILGWAPKYSIEEGLEKTIEKLKVALAKNGRPGAKKWKPTTKR